MFGEDKKFNGQKKDENKIHVTYRNNTIANQNQNQN